MEGGVTDSVRLYVSDAIHESSKVLLLELEDRVSSLDDQIRTLEDERLKRSVSTGWLRWLGRLVTGAGGGIVLYVLQHYLK